MENNYSLADLATATRSGFGGGDSWIMILLFAMIFGGNGFGYGNRGGEQYATTSDVQRGFNQQDTGAQLRGITYGISDSTYALNNTIVSGAASVKDAVASVGGIVTSEGRGLQAQIADHNCTTQRNIDSVKYDLANYNANLTSVIHAEGEATRNMLQQNKIESLQGQINQLQLQNAMCGVVRYPNASTYYAGSNPFCNCNCGNGNF